MLCSQREPLSGRIFTSRQILRAERPRDLVVARQHRHSIGRAAPLLMLGATNDAAAALEQVRFARGASRLGSEDERLAVCGGLLQLLVGHEHHLQLVDHVLARLLADVALAVRAGDSQLVLDGLLLLRAPRLGGSSHHRTRLLRRSSYERFHGRGHAPLRVVSSYTAASSPSLRVGDHLKQFPDALHRLAIQNLERLRAYPRQRHTER
jgi:hypothetical protein